jgi:hypothetical protein
MLRGGERLSPLRLSPITLCSSAPVANSTLASSQIRFGRHFRRDRQASVDDHLHPRIPNVAFPEVLEEPRLVTPHNDEPARQLGTVQHY